MAPPARPAFEDIFRARKGARPGQWWGDRAGARAWGAIVAGGSYPKAANAFVKASGS